MTDRERSAAQSAALGLISGYQSIRAGRLSPCRFVPSCSEYAREAVEYHGAVKGSWLAARRLSRCRPLGGHGYDPVPTDEIRIRTESSEVGK